MIEAGSVRRDAGRHRRRPIRARPGLLSIALLAATGCATPSGHGVATDGTGETQRTVFVAAAHPLAVEAGMEVLRKGGDAVDAAIAIQAMLGLVEPQSSGLGGGAFMVRYDARTRMVNVYDGRETAPAGATPDMFLAPDGKPSPFSTVVVSGRASGVPGVARMLALAHDRHGVLPWRDLFATTARTADRGFPVTERTIRMIALSGPKATAPDLVAYFRNGEGKPIKAGETLRNPAYAAFLRRLAAEGPDALYRGETARRIVARVHEGSLPGAMTERDLAGYRPVERAALCNPYRVYVLCVPPPPSSGVGLLELMGMIERTDIGKRGPADPVAWVRFAEASRLMYADRDAYVGDVPDVPVKGMLAPDYIAARAALVSDRLSPAPAPGTPPGAGVARIDATGEVGGTSHFVVIDARGNAVSMTTTIESFFGSGRMVDGFFLNNQMTDFSFVPRGPNAIGPGKRPRSSMVPTVILWPDRRLAGAIGSPGGNAILGYVGKALTGMVEWKMPVAEALALPNLIARGNAITGEAERFDARLSAGMAARGLVIRGSAGESSGLQGVLIHDGRFDGGADPRRDGVARTETVALPPARERRRTAAAR